MNTSYLYKTPFEDVKNLFILSPSLALRGNFCSLHFSVSDRGSIRSIRLETNYGCITEGGRPITRLVRLYRIIKENLNYIGLNFMYKGRK